jgi:flagellin
MSGQIGGLNQGIRNAQDGISLIQTAEGALNETHSILNRMRELAVQSANDTNTNEDRAEIQKEMDQLAQEVSRISNSTEFNTQKLLDGSFDAKFHIGSNAGQSMELSVNNMGSKELGVEGVAYTKDVGVVSVTTQDNTLNVVLSDPGGNDASLTSSFDEGTNTITVSLATNGSGAITSTAGDVKSVLEGYGLTVDYSGTNTESTTAAAVASTTIDTLDAEASKNFGINVSTQTAADTAITTIDNAISKVSAERSKLGAVQNRLDHTINNLTATSENLSAAESRIRDVDMAREMMEFTKNNILSQASTAMLAQANQMPQGVLQLLG